MSFHKAFLLLWMFDLIMFPILAALELGLSIVSIQSNYLARFSYLPTFLLALTYVACIKRKVIRHPLVIAFIVVFIVGSLKGIVAGYLNVAFLSHLFYAFMPIVMISYGWYFFESYENSPSLKSKLSSVMYSAFYFGAFAVVIFVIAYQLGLAKYDAIGLSNFVYSGPFLLYQQHGVAYFILSLLGAFLSGKRGVIAIFVAFLIVYVYVAKRSDKSKFIAITSIGIVIVVALFADQIESAWSRIDRTIVALQKGDFDIAFAMRWSESISALEYLINRVDHLLIGAGFGARFLPWPDHSGYEDYFSHYTHFSVISYMWLGGILFSLYIYSVLFGLGISLVRSVRLGLVKRTHYHFAYWLWGILVMSLSGADLMNNPYLWFIIGCCLHLNRRYSFRGALRSSSWLSSRPNMPPYSDSQSGRSRPATLV